MKHDISKHGSPWKEQLHTPDIKPIEGEALSTLLTRLVASGVMTPRVAERIAKEMYLRTQRIIVYNRLCSYIDKRIQQERTE